MNDLALFPDVLPALAADDRAFLDVKAEQIRAVASSAVIEIGRHLIEVKARVGRGHFLDWIQQQFQWSDKSAENYMRVAQHFGNSKELSNLPVTREALYLLAGPTVPEEVRQDAVERAEAGERITKQEAEAMIAYRCDS